MEIQNTSNVIRENQYGNGTAGEQGRVQNTQNAQNIPQNPVANQLQLSVGQFFRGMVTDVRNDSMVQILLGDERQVQANIQGKMNLNIGEKILFQVKEMQGDKLVITPTSYDGTNEAISRALLGAGMPETDRNIVLVKELMNHNQPIDKETLMNLQRGVRDFPTASVSSIVELNAHGITVSEESLQALENYKNSSYQMQEQVSSLADGMVDVLQKMAEDPFTTLTTTTEVFQNLAEAIFAEEISEEASQEVSEGASKEALVQEMNEISEDLKDGEAETSQEVEKSFAETAKEMLSEARTVEDFRQVVTYINENIENASELKEIFADPKIKEHLKERMLSKLSIRPEELQGKPEELRGKIDKLYENIERITKGLENGFGAENRFAEQLKENAKSFQKNMNFMSDLNTLASFVQFPVKLTGEDGNAELYVYNKRRGKVKPGDTLTAFLHFDLESLGATDIHVSMTGQNVTVAFSLENASSARLVDKHIGELQERLEEIGYHASCKTETAKLEKENPADRIFSKDEEAISIKRYLFDIRA